MPRLTNQDYINASHARSVVPPPRIWPLGQTGVPDDVTDVDDIVSMMTWHSLRHRNAEDLHSIP